MNRTFGVEIEAYGVAHATIASELNAAGIACQVEGYNHRTRRHWKVVTDASLRGSYAFELVSPVIQFNEAGLAEVRQVCEILTRLGVKVNKTCGLHVHIDAGDYTLQNFKNMSKAWMKNEATIDTWMPASRRGRGNQYCKSNAMHLAQHGGFDTIDRARTVEQIIALTNGYSLSTNAYSGSGDRFYKLNLTAFWRHRTIEFRHHSGSVDADKVTNWIAFVANFVEYMKDERPRGARAGAAQMNEYQKTYHMFMRMNVKKNGRKRVEGDLEQLFDFYRARQTQHEGGGRRTPRTRRPRRAAVVTAPRDTMTNPGASTLDQLTNAVADVRS